VVDNDAPATRWLDRLPLLLGALFGVGGLFHLIGIFAPGIGNAASSGRHAVFVGINAFFAAAFVLRRRWTIVPVSALVAQQAYSHGEDLVLAHREGRTDVQSLVVLLFLPVVVAVAVRLARRPLAPRDASTK
jgi:hypothetical protein